MMKTLHKKRFREVRFYAFLSRSEVKALYVLVMTKNMLKKILEGKEWVERVTSCRIFIMWEIYILWHVEYSIDLFHFIKYMFVRNDYYTKFHFLLLLFNVHDQARYGSQPL